MVWLASGIALFVLLHLSAAAVPGARTALIQRFGASAYRAAFAALVAMSFVLIVIGWRRTPPLALYTPPSWAAFVALPMMLAAVFLLSTAHAKSNVKRALRHPLLTAVVVWSAAHLLANGDHRALLLFTAFGVWAIVETMLLNRRDGEWHKPLPATRRQELIGVTISLVVFLVLLALHPYYAGVSALARVTQTAP